MIYSTQSFIGRDWRGDEVIVIVYQTTKRIYVNDCYTDLLHALDVPLSDRFRVETRWDAFRRWWRYLWPN